MAARNRGPIARSREVAVLSRAGLSPPLIGAPSRGSSPVGIDGKMASFVRVIRHEHLLVERLSIRALVHLRSARMWSPVLVACLSMTYAAISSRRPAMI